MTTHYDWSPTGSNRTACGTRTDRSNITTEATLVDCTRCQRSGSYRLTKARAEGKARTLRKAWLAVADAIQQSPDPSDRMVVAEQEAYDALVDHIDATGLTYSEHDPRGQE